MSSNPLEKRRHNFGLFESLHAQIQKMPRYKRPKIDEEEPRTAGLQMHLRHVRRMRRLRLRGLGEPVTNSEVALFMPFVFVHQVSLIVVSGATKDKNYTRTGR